MRWYAALTALAGVKPSDLVVHAVGSTSSEILRFLTTQGVTIRSVERFDVRSPHCNKISGALRLADFPVTGMAVLCDTDVAVLEDPRRVNLPPGAVAGKLVDAPVPPLDVIRNIFFAAGLNPPSTVPLPWGPDDWTVTGNSNGGLYLIPGPLLPKVATAWAHWARWLLDRSELLEEWTVYVDQVAMAVALAGENIGSTPLDVRWNTPTHDPSRIPSDAPEPAVVHYHQEVDRRGLIGLSGTASIDRRIAEVNRVIREVWTQASPDTTYHKWLSLAEPEAVADGTPDDLRTILVALLKALEPADGTRARRLGRRQPGHDDRALPGDRPVRARGSHSGRNEAEADLTLCLDQLTHPMSGAAYREVVELAWRRTRQALVVSGYEDPDSARDPALEFHEPLSATLRRVAPAAEIYPVASNPSFTTFVVLRAPEDSHPRDYAPGTLAPLVSRHPDPLSLITMRLHARRTTGFYPDHAPRLWEYPVVARIVAEHLPPGSRLVDLGAGVTPLAPFLTSRGYVVDTVDPSPIVRTWPPQPEWNEWDFLDYGAAGLARRSWNCVLGDLPTRPPFDGIYSISVIEHVPATVRRALLADISARTRLGGLVVLTIDLVRGGDQLWNLNLGVEVEEPTKHGTLQQVAEECAAVGLELFREDVVRDWGESRVDIGLLALRQTGVRTHRRWRVTKRQVLSRIQRRSMT